MWSSSYKHTHIQSLLARHSVSAPRGCSEKLTWSSDLNFSTHARCSRWRGPRSRAENGQDFVGAVPLVCCNQDSRGGGCTPEARPSGGQSGSRLTSREALPLVTWSSLPRSCFNKRLLCWVNASGCWQGSDPPGPGGALRARSLPPEPSAQENKKKKIVKDVLYQRKY